MQLNLFDKSKDEATLFVFPPYRRAAAVRQAAAEILRKDYKSGRAFWSKHTAQLRRSLLGLGMDRASVTAEIDRYAEAVSRELNISQHYRRPDGAA
jgi:hypothetical protein